ncbi:MAG: hypothetical protein AB7O59_23170 [Pirellulales bacterium]
MIRVATEERRRRVREELSMPSPERISRLTAEIRKTWSPAKYARRAGLARRVQVMVVHMLDLELETDGAESKA